MREPQMVFPVLPPGSSPSCFRACMSSTRRISRSMTRAIAVKLAWTPRKRCVLWFAKSTIDRVPGASRFALPRFRLDASLSNSAVVLPAPERIAAGIFVANSRSTSTRALAAAFATLGNTASTDASSDAPTRMRMSANYAPWTT